MGKFNPPVKQGGSLGDRKTINISMTRQMYAEIKEQAEARGYTSRNGAAQFMRLMIAHCLEDLVKGKPGRKKEPATIEVSESAYSSAR